MGEEKGKDIENKQNEYEKKPIPDGGYGWVVLVASFFVSFVYDGIMYTFNIPQRDIGIYFETSDKVKNSLTAINTGLLFCSGPIVGGLTNMFGCRIVVVVASFIVAALYFLCTVSHDIWLIIVFYGVFGGIATGCAYIASLIVIAEYFDKKVGIATGIVMAGSGVGSSIFPLVIPYINTNKRFGEHDWKVTMNVYAIFLTFCCFLGLFFAPLNPRSMSKKQPMELKNLKKSNKDDELQDCVVHDEKVIQTYLGSMYSLKSEKIPFHKRNQFIRVSLELVSETFNISLVFKNFALALICLSNLFTFGSFFIPYIYIKQISETYAGFSGSSIEMPEHSNITETTTILLQTITPKPDFFSLASITSFVTTSGTVLALIGFLNVPFRILFGIIADKRFVSPICLNTICVGLCVVPFYMFDIMLKDSVLGIYFFAVMFATGTAGMNSLTTKYLLDIVEYDKFANSMGIVNLFRGIGAITGPILSGAIKDKFDLDETTLFYFPALCFTVGFILSLMASIPCITKSCCYTPLKSQTNDDKTLIKDPTRPVNA